MRRRRVADAPHPDALATLCAASARLSDSRRVAVSRRPSGLSSSMSTIQPTTPPVAESLPAEDELVVSVVIPCLNEEDEHRGAASARRARCSPSTACRARSSSPTTRPRTAAPSSPPTRARASCTSRAAATAAPTWPGFAVARGRYIVMADADLTYDFGEIPRFVERARRRRRDGDRRPDGQHPPRRHAVAAPLRRQPGAHRRPQPLLPHRRVATRTAACGRFAATCCRASTCGPRGWSSPPRW